MVYEYQITEEMIRCFNSCVKEKNYKLFVSSYSYGMYKTFDIIRRVPIADGKIFFITQNLRRFLRYLENFNYRNPNEDVKGVYNSELDGLGIKICSDIKDAIMTMNWDGFYRKYRSIADHIINESRNQRIADICIQFGSSCWKNFSAKDDVANNSYSDVESSHCHNCKSSTQTVLVSSKNSMGMLKKNNNTIKFPPMMVQPRSTSSTGYSSNMQQNITEPNGSILFGNNYLGIQYLYDVVVEEDNESPNVFLDTLHDLEKNKPVSPNRDQEDSETDTELNNFLTKYEESLGLTYATESFTSEPDSQPSEASKECQPEDVTSQNSLMPGKTAENLNQIKEIIELKEEEAVTNALDENSEDGNKTVELSSSSTEAAATINLVNSSNTELSDKTYSDDYGSDDEEGRRRIQEQEERNNRELETMRKKRELQRMSRVN